TPEAGEREKATALDLLNTITEKVRENSFASAAALIIHAEDELVKDITKQQPPTTDQQEKEFVRKRFRSESLDISSYFCEPWGSFMKIMHDVLRYGQSETPLPSGDSLSLTRKALY
ncbi:hypothetical protein BGX27_005156, partial [Mortierella sp. AM989]